MSTVSPLRRFRGVAITGGAVATLAIAGCSSSPASSSTAADGAVTLSATEDKCEPSRAQFQAGKVTFNATNNGSRVTEVYVYAEANGAFNKVVAEVENIGPGTSRDLTVDLADGTYELACKPGQKGDGIRTRLTVGTGAQPSGSAGPSAGASTESSAKYDREVELSTDGRTVSGTVGSPRVGDAIEFKLENKTTGPVVLELKKPDGTVAGETTDIQANATGELIAKLDSPGSWQVVVEGPTPEPTLPFEVR